jgi:uncharacterized protein (DUF1684 family)
MIKRAFCFGMTVLLLTGICGTANPKEPETRDETILAIQIFREEKDRFFKNAPNSPLEEFDRLRFKGLQYFPANPMYCFEGEIKRYIININDPKYYATFQTNKGPKKRYIRYGRFRFKLEGKDYTLELYKSILGDRIFIPFYDKTNGQETYEGGRYVDSEILMPGYHIVIDFNYAYNPSCAYNDKFICILPLEENRLNIAIPAGEKKFR